VLRILWNLQRGNEDAEQGVAAATGISLFFCLLIFVPFAAGGSTCFVLLRKGFALPFGFFPVVAVWVFSLPPVDFVAFVVIPQVMTERAANFAALFYFDPVSIPSGRLPAAGMKMQNNPPHPTPISLNYVAEFFHGVDRLFAFSPLNFTRRASRISLQSCEHSSPHVSISARASRAAGSSSSIMWTPPVGSGMASFKKGISVLGWLFGVLLG